jgi:hypothetical protein
VKTANGGIRADQLATRIIDLVIRAKAPDHGRNEGIVQPTFQDPSLSSPWCKPRGSIFPIVVFNPLKTITCGRPTGRFGGSVDDFVAEESSQIHQVPQPSVCNLLIIREEFKVDPLVPNQWAELTGDP